MRRDTVAYRSVCVCVWGGNNFRPFAVLHIFNSNILCVACSTAPLMPVLLRLTYRLIVTDAQDIDFETQEEYADDVV